MPCCPNNPNLSKCRSSCSHTAVQWVEQKSKKERRGKRERTKKTEEKHRAENISVVP
jgi:hypothetical protein